MLVSPCSHAPMRLCVRPLLCRSSCVLDGTVATEAWLLASTWNSDFGTVQPKSDGPAEPL